MRPIARLALTALGALLLSACATTNVRSFVERGIDVQQYRTSSGGPPREQATGDSRLDDNRFFQGRHQGPRLSVA